MVNTSNLPPSVQTAISLQQGTTTTGGVSFGKGSGSGGNITIQDIQKQQAKSPSTIEGKTKAELSPKELALYKIWGARGLMPREQTERVTAEQLAMKRLETERQQSLNLPVQFRGVPKEQIMSVELQEQIRQQQMNLPYTTTAPRVEMRKYPVLEMPKDIQAGIRQQVYERAGQTISKPVEPIKKIEATNPIEEFASGGKGIITGAIESVSKGSVEYFKAMENIGEESYNLLTAEPLGKATYAQRMKTYEASRAIDSELKNIFTNPSIIQGTVTIAGGYLLAGKVPFPKVTNPVLGTVAAYDFMKEPSASKAGQYTALGLIGLGLQTFPEVGFRVYERSVKPFTRNIEKTQLGFDILKRSENIRGNLGKVTTSPVTPRGTAKGIELTQYIMLNKQQPIPKPIRLLPYKPQQPNLALRAMSVPKRSVESLLYKPKSIGYIEAKILPYKPQQIFIENVATGERLFLDIGTREYLYSKPKNPFINIEPKEIIASKKPVQKPIEIEKPTGTGTIQIIKLEPPKVRQVQMQKTQLVLIQKQKAVTLSGLYLRSKLNALVGAKTKSKLNVLVGSKARSISISRVKLMPELRQIQKTKIRNIAIIKAKSTAKEKTEIIIIPKSRQIQKTASGLIFYPIISSKVISTEKIVSKPRIFEPEINVPSDITKTTEPQKQIPKISRIPELIKPRPKTPEPKPPETPPPPIVPIPEEEELKKRYSKPVIKKKFPKFISQIKRRGKFVNIGTFSSAEKALGFGIERARKTLGASTRVMSEQGIVMPKALPTDFYLSKKAAGTLIQKRSQRLSSREERISIQLAKKAKGGKMKWF